MDIIGHAREGAAHPGRPGAWANFQELGAGSADLVTPEPES